MTTRRWPPKAQPVIPSFIWEEKVKRAFPDGMYDGTDLTIEYKCGYEKGGCYDSWCHIWIVSIRLGHFQSDPGYEWELHDSGRELEPVIDKVLKHLFIFKALVRYDPEAVRYGLSQFTLRQQNKVLLPNSYDFSKLIRAVYNMKDAKPEEVNSKLTEISAATEPMRSMLRERLAERTKSE